MKQTNNFKNKKKKPGKIRKLMYVYVLPITYAFNDVISVKNQRKCKKIMFEVRT